MYPRPNMGIGQWAPPDLPVVVKSLGEAGSRRQKAGKWEPSEVECARVAVSPRHTIPLK